MGTSTSSAPRLVAADSLAEPPNCPAGAIPKAAPQKVDKHKCISCLRCIQICPQSARGVPLPLRLAAAATVKKYCAGRKEPKFYL